MPDEVKDCTELSHRVETEQQSTEPDKQVRKALIAKALELGCVEAIPDDWGIEVHHG